MGSIMASAPCENPGVAGRLHVGTSGFAFDEWKGNFYPADMKSREMLSYYAARFGTVEINYTFRRHPSESTLAGWQAQTPDGFVFVLKAHQQITHRLRLANAAEATTFFLDRAKGLGDRLGPILFQCPPSLRFDRGLIEGFLAGLPTQGFRYAFEFRHASWAEARPIIEAAGAAWVLAETDEGEAPEGPLANGPLAYLRLRRSDYSESDLAAWAGRLREAVAAGTDVFCFLKHEEEGLGPAFAGRLEELAATP